MSTRSSPVDAVNFAPYKFGGVRGLGAGWISERVMNLPHRKVLKDPQSNWEMGGCAPGMYACLSAIFDYVVTLGKYFLKDETDRRTLYLKGMETIKLHERELLHRLLYGSENLTYSKTLGKSTKRYKKIGRNTQYETKKTGKNRAAGKRDRFRRGMAGTASGGGWH